MTTRRLAPSDGAQRRPRPGLLRAPVAVLDLAFALTAAFALPAPLVRLAAGRRRTRTGGGRGLLALDCAYSLPVLRARQMEYIVLARDLDGWFDRSWVVHPLVGASPDDPLGVGIGPARVTALDARRAMVEGKVSRFGHLTALPFTNFVLGQISVLRVLSRILRRESVSVVTIADPYYLGVLGYALARAARLPLALAVNANHDALYEQTGTLAYPRLMRRRSVEKRIDRFVIPRCDMVLVASDNNTEFAVDNGARPERLRRVHRGAAIHPMHLAALEDRVDVSSDTGSGPYAICVSRLEPAKEPADVLEALAEARLAHPDLALVLVGEGSMRAELEARARELGVEAHVRFVGVRDQTWVAAALRDASVVLAPIAGRALLEAMLSSTPVVAYDREWHGEVIRDGETGLLVPHGDTRAMGVATAALVADPDRARALGMRAREEIMAMKDPHAVAAELRAQYEWLLERGGRPDRAAGLV